MGGFLESARLVFFFFFGVIFFVLGCLSGTARSETGGHSKDDGRAVSRPAISPCVVGKRKKGNSRVGDVRSINLSPPVFAFSTEGLNGRPVVVVGARKQLSARL